MATGGNENASDATSVNSHSQSSMSQSAISNSMSQSSASQNITNSGSTSQSTSTTSAISSNIGSNFSTSSESAQDSNSMDIQQVLRRVRRFVISDDETNEGNEDIADQSISTLAQGSESTGDEENLLTQISSQILNQAQNSTSDLQMSGMSGEGTNTASTSSTGSGGTSESESTMHSISMSVSERIGSESMTPSMSFTGQ